MIAMIIMITISRIFPMAFCILFGAGNSAARAAKVYLASGPEIVGRRLARTAIGDDFVRDLLAFAQRSQTSTFNGADVNEHVLAAVLGLNETKALGRVEPLNDTVCHLILKNLFRGPSADPRLP